MRKIIIPVIALLMSGPGLLAQDPHFSQFFMAPLLVNPATTGTGYGDWRVMSNYRRQWGNAGTPFNTFTLSGDMKVMGKEDGQNTLGLGLTFMQDQSMQGAFKSIYASGTMAYHVQLNENNRIGMGIDGSYGNRTLDYSKLNFGEQFTGHGFDVSLPSGETALSNMKPFFSVGAGLLYSFQSEYLNVDIGAAGYHFNKPRQTFVNDPQQFVPVRYVGHMNMEYVISSQLLLNINAVYQQQSIQNYFAGGGALGLDISRGEGKQIIFAGAWYRQRDAFYPYISMMYDNVQVGVSYDITTSKQAQGAISPQTFEMSVVIRNIQTKPGVIWCPWK